MDQHGSYDIYNIVIYCLVRNAMNLRWEPNLWLQKHGQPSTHMISTKKRSIDSMMIPAMCKSLKWLNHVCNIITSYHIIYNIYKQMIRSPPRQKKFTLCWRTSTRCASYTSMAGITLARPPENCPVGDPGRPRSHKGGWRQGNDHVNVCESCLMFVVRHIMD